MSAPAPELSIVILSWNTRELLQRCLESLRQVRDGVRRELLVVDNASSDGSSEMVRERFPEARLLVNARNEGYARGNNIGIAATSGANVLLLNSDTEVRDGSLDKLVGFLRGHRAHGAVGAGLLNADGSVQPCCMRFPTLLVPLFFDMNLDKRWPRNPVMRRYFMRDYDHRTSRDVDQPPGACLLIRREVLEKVGVFDEELWLYFNDVDLCKRIRRAGWLIHYLVEAPVVHHVGQSTKRFSTRVVEWHRNRLAYFRKHYGRLGAAWVRCMVRWRAWEERRRLRRELRDAGEREAALRELEGIVRDIFAPEARRGA
ncbi:MAG: glycosyltransferase family 2 protein [Planctomycetes bacterium]|nr:glycosyltransferase family 2 protein [Planctomycetota bacterium]